MLNLIKLLIKAIFTVITIIIRTATMLVTKIVKIVVIIFVGIILLVKKHRNKNCIKVKWTEVK